MAQTILVAHLMALWAHFS